MKRRKTVRVYSAITGDFVEIERIDFNSAVVDEFFNGESIIDTDEGGKYSVVVSTYSGNKKAYP